MEVMFITVNKQRGIGRKDLDGRNAWKNELLRGSSSELKSINQSNYHKVDKNNKYIISGRRIKNAAQFSERCLLSIMNTSKHHIVFVHVR